MLRLSLSDAKWELWEKNLHDCGVYKTKNLRLIVEGILWRIRTGAPWRDLPSELGPWKTVYNQFNRWSKKGIWQKIFVGGLHRVIDRPNLHLRGIVRPCTSNQRWGYHEIYLFYDISHFNILLHYDIRCLAVVNDIWETSETYEGAAQSLLLVLTERRCIPFSNGFCRGYAKNGGYTGNKLLQNG